MQLKPRQLMHAPSTWGGLLPQIWTQVRCTNSSSSIFLLVTPIFSIFCLYRFLFFLFCWPILASFRTVRLAHQGKDGCLGNGAVPSTALAERPEELAISANSA
jgi:hypothetical protein